ncbi:MAG: hypothetical protein EOO48_10335 [Flavobacterium sp.]|nr:MAG: hypothetical protein EOO48_10335 [Flavobacterium sp.]
MNQEVLIFPALQGNFIDEEVRRYATKQNWKIIDGYNFGGYAKVSRELVDFINDFYVKTRIPLDPVYTGKLLFGVMDLIAQDYFAPGSKILAIHTGGLQGVKGMNKILKNKNLPLLEIDV